MNLTRYHGVFAPNSKLRSRIVPGRRSPPGAPAGTPTPKPAEQRIQPEPGRAIRLTWAERLKRAFQLDVTVCPLCGGRLRVIAG